jgi:hypothetical protein
VSTNEIIWQDLGQALEVRHLVFCFLSTCIPASLRTPEGHLGFEFSEDSSNT